MAVRQYIGARYVTKIYENSTDPSSAEWESGVRYEPLTLVTFNFSSYLSKKEVPNNIGDPASNPSYWVVTGAYNGQIATLDSRINAIENKVPDYDKLGDIYSSYKIINVLFPPAASDVPLVADYVGGTYTDNSQRLQDLYDTYGNEHTYYFPSGVYGFSSPIHMKDNQIGIIGDGVAFTRLHFNNAVDNDFFVIGDEGQLNRDINISHIGFICDDMTIQQNAIHLNNPSATFMEDIFFSDFTNDVYLDAIYASSGQTSQFNWLWHLGNNRAASANPQNRMFYFNKASDSIFPNGIFIDNCHGSFGSEGTFAEGFVADIWITRCNIAYCKNTLSLNAGNPDVSGDCHITDNVFADCVGHVIILRHWNRGVVISNNMIEQNAPYSGSVFAAFRLSDCNGVIISNNTVGTERIAAGISHLIAFLLCENTVKDFVITGNVAYIGGYVFINGTSNNDFIIADNHFEHVGDNATQANAFYIGALTNSNIHDNRLKNFAALNSAYTTSNVKNSHNMYESSTVINSPFIAADNYPI